MCVLHIILLSKVRVLNWGASIQTLEEELWQVIAFIGLMVERGFNLCNLLWILGSPPPPRRRRRGSGGVKGAYFESISLYIFRSSIRPWASGPNFCYTSAFPYHTFPFDGLFGTFGITLGFDYFSISNTLSSIIPLYSYFFFLFSFSFTYSHF